MVLMRSISITGLNLDGSDREKTRTVIRGMRWLGGSEETALIYWTGKQVRFDILIV